MELRHVSKASAAEAVPAGWKTKELREVAQVRSGIAKNANVAVVDPIRVHYLRVANVQDGFLDLSEVSTIEIGRSDLMRYAVLAGDVLMNEGGDLDKLGRGAIWKGDFEPCVHQNHVFVVRCGSQLSSDYLNTWSAATAARRYFMVAGKQTTNLASISKTALERLPVALPPLAEQRAIAEALGDVDALIGALERLIAKKRDLKQATMQQLLTGQTRLPGFSGEWQTKRLGGECELVTKGTTPTSLGRAFVVQGTNFVKIESIATDGVVLTDMLAAIDGVTHRLLKRSQLEVDDILFSIAGALGRTALVKASLLPANTNQALAIIRLKKQSRLVPGFLVKYLAGPQIAAHVAAISVQAAQANISLEDVGNFPVPLPSPSEQTAIAAVLSDMDAELTALEQRRDKTRMIKQGMMQELLTGRVRLV